MATDPRPDQPPLPMTDRFLAAVALANEVHGSVRRLGTNIPYMAHLLVVARLVLEDGGDEDEAIAALLHDAVEDGGGRALLQRIAAPFGPRVAAIVAACSDTLTPSSPPPQSARRPRSNARRVMRGCQLDAPVAVADDRLAQRGERAVRGRHAAGVDVSVGAGGPGPCEHLGYRDAARSRDARR